jgi:hypothetical protein
LELIDQAERRARLLDQNRIRRPKLREFLDLCFEAGCFVTFSGSMRPTKTKTLAPLQLPIPHKIRGRR